MTYYKLYFTISLMFSILISNSFGKSNITNTPKKISTQNKSSEVILVHNSNMRAIFDEVRLHQSQEGTLTRLDHYLKMERKLKKDIFYFNIGSSYVKTNLHKVLSFHIISQILLKLQPDALTVGAKSLLGAKDEILELVKKSNWAYLCCNVNLAEFVPHKTFLLQNGVYLVVIGYMSTIINDMPVDIKAEDPIKSIRKIVNGIKIEKKIVVVMGCGSRGIEQELADSIVEIDVIIGETSLINGTNRYPIKYRNKWNKTVYLLKTSSAKKHFGLARLTIDGEGKILTVTGNLTNMSFYNRTNKDLTMTLRMFKPVLEKYDGEIIARARVNFNPQCRRYECNLGNLITDAFVEYKAMQFKNQPFWTDTAIGIINAGAIKEGINLDIRNGEITRADLLNVLPRKELLVSLTVTGASLYAILEQGMKNWETQDDKGSFLQVSGLHLICNKSMPSGSKVQFIRARCADCFVPSYSPVDQEAEYRIITNEYLANGGDGYALLKDGKNHVYEGITDVDAVILYVQTHRLVTTEVGDRLGTIVFLDKATSVSDSLPVLILCLFFLNF